jgi:hypothetical protein
VDTEVEQSPGDGPDPCGTNSSSRVLDLAGDQLCNEIRVRTRRLMAELSDFSPDLWQLIDELETAAVPRFSTSTLIHSNPDVDHYGIFSLLKKARLPVQVS